jgi:pre-mRNA-splicing factor SYF1
MNGANGDDDNDDAENDGQRDAMMALERQARAPVGFVAASTGPQGGTQPVQSVQPAAPLPNPDVIDVDVDDDE